MRSISIKTISMAYIAIGILTFGYGAANVDCGNLSKLSELDCSDYAAASGSFAGLFWPLYWSWELFE